MTTIAAALACWVAGLRFADLPAVVVADCRLRILDTLGIALAATKLPIGQSIRAGAAALGGGDEATSIGYGERNSAALTALINGTLAHALDFDDTHNASVMHPSAPIVAAALAMTEAGGRSGADLVVAVALGIEIANRLGMAAPGAFHEPGLHPTSVLGTPAAALSAGWLLSLPPESLVDALGISGSQASGVLEAYSDGTWSKTLHPGWAAHAGIVAARLAEAGFSGPASIIEGRYGIFRSHVQAAGYKFDFARVIDRLGTRWESLDTAFKLFPCAHSIHAFVEAALSLRAEHRIAPGMISRITMDVPAGFVGQIAEPRAAKLAPRTTTHARASLFYAVAAALTDGELGMAHYTEAAIARADIAALASLCDYRGDTAEGSIRFSGTVAIELADARTVATTIAEADGTGTRLLDAAAVERKFRTTAGTVLPPKQVEAVIELVRHVETLDRIDPLFLASRWPAAP